MLSTDAFHARSIWLSEIYVVVRAVGTDGGIISDEIAYARLLLSI